MENQYHSQSTSTPGTRIEHVHKIAVLRANTLGDFLFTLPALEALRDTYPSAEIVLLGKAWHATFLANRPSPVDRVIVIPPYGGVGEMPEIEEDANAITQFFSAMVAEQFDLAIQMHGGGGYPNRFIQQLGARVTVGLQDHNAVPLDRSQHYSFFQHEVIRYLELVSLVGATTQYTQPRVMVTRQDLDEVFRILPSMHQPRIALHPGAPDIRRSWPPHYFAHVGDILSQTGAQVVVTGTIDEQSITQQVVEAMQTPALDLSGQLSPGGLAGLFSGCHVVIANDSGPLHLAGAVGSPTVGLFWCGNFINYAPLTRERQLPFVSWRLHCPICNTNCLESYCTHQVSFISDIAPEEVAQAALNLFYTSQKNIITRGPGVGEFYG